MARLDKGPMFFNLVKSASRLLRIRETRSRRQRRRTLLALLWGACGVNSALANPSVLTFTQLLACPVNVAAFQETSASASTLPETIRSVVGQQVRVTGYMLPLVMENGHARELLLMRNTMACCYGQAPAANEYVVVKIPSPGVPVTQDVPVAMQGTLRIDPVLLGGVLVEFFHLDNATLATR